jgi:hypothetical protein
MEPCNTEDEAEIDDALAIELEFFHRGPTARRQPHDMQAPPDPGKVIAPALTPRMKERNDFPRKRIATFRFRVFVIIAPLAGQGEILGARLAPSVARHDVLNREALGGNVCRAAAVLAAVPGPLFHEAPQRDADTLFTHTLGP